MEKYINMEKVSDYGKNNNRIDYGYLAKQEVDNMILCNEMAKRYGDTLEVEYNADNLYTYFNEDYEEIEDSENFYDYEMNEIFQWYIINDSSAERLAEYGQTILYDNELDLWVWAITHFGTGWDYVLTGTKINDSKE